MKNPFKKEVVTYKSEEPSTPYQRAGQEWDLRIGSSADQAKNWRLCALLSLAVSVLTVLILIITLATHKEKIFIAEVTKEGRVVNVAPLTIKYQPNEAQKEYFIANFIELTRSLTLDPVAVKKNWVSAYNFLSNRGAKQFSKYFKEANPIAILGKKTVTIQITDINPVSPATMHVNWTETTVNTNGIFTIALKQPTTRAEILRNPLGIYIVDFNISTPK